MTQAEVVEAFLVAAETVGLVARLVAPVAAAKLKRLVAPAAPLAGQAPEPAARFLSSAHSYVSS